MSLNKHESCIVCGHNDLKPVIGYEKHYLTKCSNCTMVFSQRIPTIQELTDFYQNYSYNREVFVSPVTIKRYNELLDEFEKYRKNNRMLDVGCGVGLFLNVARERGWEVYGTEYSPKAIEICESKGITMKQGKLDAAAYGNLEFDVVTSFEVMEHIYNPVEEMENISKLLRKGGLFYCTTPNYNALVRYYLKAEYNIFSYPEHLSYYTPTSLRYLAEQQKFHYKKVFTSGISFSRISASKNRDKKIPIVGAQSTDERVRQSMESNSAMNMLKQLANFIFKVTGTGFNMKGYFEK